MCFFPTACYPTIHSMDIKMQIVQSSCYCLLRMWWNWVLLCRWSGCVDWISSAQNSAHSRKTANECNSCYLHFCAGDLIRHKGRSANRKWTLLRNSATLASVEGKLDQKDEKGDRVADQENAERHRQLLQGHRRAGLLDLNAGVVVVQKAGVWTPFAPPPV